MKVKAMKNETLPKIMIEAKSSNISKFGYKAAKKLLYIEFKDGGVYKFSKVSKKTYNDLIDAKSVSKFFHANIKGKFESEKVEIDSLKEEEQPAEEEEISTVEEWQYTERGLEITFNNQEVIIYPDAPEALIEGLNNAGDATKYFLAQIQPVYEMVLASE